METGWQYAFTLTTVVVSLVMRRMFGERHRFVWTPIAFGFYLAGECGMAKLSGNWYYYEFLRLMITFAKAYLLCGFVLGPWRRNPIVPWFFAFWCYFEFAVVFGEAPFYAFYFYLKTLEVVAIGYYAGVWAVTTPDGVRRLLKWGSAGAAVVAFVWITKGGLLNESSMDMRQGRAGVDVEMFDAETVNLLFNVNGIGLVLSAAVIYPFLFAFQKAKLWMRLAAMGVAFVLTVLVIRTGARNSALVVVPMAWYMLCAKTSLATWKKALAVVVLLGGMGAYLVHMEKDVGKIRAFDIFEKGKGDDAGSGRIGAFKVWVDEMGGCYVMGAGAKYDHSMERMAVGNMHSVYMQVFYQSGIVGSVLLLLFVLAFVSRCLTSRQNPYRHMALALLGVWLMTGVGESANINGGSGRALVALGLAMALLSNRRLRPERARPPAVVNYRLPAPPPARQADWSRQ